MPGALVAGVASRCALSDMLRSAPHMVAQSARSCGVAVSVVHHDMLSSHIAAQQEVLASCASQESRAAASVDGVRAAHALRCFVSCL